MFLEAARTEEIARGGMKAVTLGGWEIVVCNYDGGFYAVDRRCGHMNSPLDQGTLEGRVLSCPMHDARFDIVTGEALSGPASAPGFPEPLPESYARYLARADRLAAEVKVHRLRTWPVKVEEGLVKVDVPVGKEGLEDYNDDI